jgi:hypothetical protein
VEHYLPLKQVKYELFISCAVPGSDFHLEVISGPNSVKSDLKIKEGMYQSTEGGWYFNFQRKRLDGRLHLTRGVNPVTLQLSGAVTTINIGIYQDGTIEQEFS